MIIEGVCVDSSSVSRRQLRLERGLIVETGAALGKADEAYGDDCFIFAGLGDVHIHAREDVSGKNCYKEDFTTAHAAMLNGGVTHAGDMPNNPIPPVDDASYEAKFSLGQKCGGDLWFYAGIGPGTSPLSYRVPYKVYMGPSVGELFFKDLASLDATLARYRGRDVSFHCEDPELIEASKGESHHHLRRPVKAEVVATRDALMLIEKYELNGKLCHYSSGEGLELIRAARARGVKVEIEVTPQHLYFDIDHIKEPDWKRFQMNPPIRYESDRNVLLQALKNGEITYLATDHAPHTHEEKEKGTSGLTGLDTFGPFVGWLLQQGVDPQLIARVAAENPGKFFNRFLPSWKKLSPSYDSWGLGLGQLAPGFRANLTVLSAKKTTTVTAGKLKTKVGHSPFEGLTLPGQVEAVFLGGQKV